jgi:hypothetical protein
MDMPHLSETNYYEDHKVPFLWRSNSGDAMTLLLSDVPVAAKPWQTLNEPSSTQINEPGLQAEVDGPFSETFMTWTDWTLEATSDWAGDEASDPSALANRDRLVFLSRKYARGCSNEEEARLEILTERVRALLPRITEDDFHRLEDVALEFSTIHEQNQRLREKLNLY